LTLAIVHAAGGKYLLAGSARDHGLYAFALTQEHGAEETPHKLLDLPDPNAHIRKIKVLSRNRFELQTIPFTYSLIAQTARQDRIHYEAQWLPAQQQWKLHRTTQ